MARSGASNLDPIHSFQSPAGWNCRPGAGFSDLIPSSVGVSRRFDTPVMRPYDPVQRDFLQATPRSGASQMFEHRGGILALRSLALLVCLGLASGCEQDATAAAPEAAPSPSPSPPPPPPPSAQAPLPPTGLGATPSNAKASLVWSASSGATTYEVRRSTVSGGPYAQIATAASPSYTDATVSNGTTYYYVVAAANAAGMSAISAQASATPSAPVSAPTVPSAPTSVVATGGNAQVSLTWSASSGATRYNLKRATVSGGPYSQIAMPGSTSYTDGSLTNGTAYYYVVTAVSSSGESTNSAQASATPAVPAPPPTTFGTWINVTPPGVILSDTLGCGNFGAWTVQADPARPSNMYIQFNCQGIWKSTDYGATWNGPINTGSNGATVSDCAGGISIPPNSTASAPVIYLACTRGNGTGFWRSLDGGVNWTRYSVAPSGPSRQDYYPAAVDPYDQNHLLMAGHEMNFLVESFDGGQNWNNLTLPSGMQTPGGTAGIFFINTGNAGATRGNWLWIAQHNDGRSGTWRTTNGGANWNFVDKNEHPHGSSQIYQPDNNGVVYMAGAYSASGWGVVRSSDYGQTWSHVGIASSQLVVFGSAKNVYMMSAPGGGGSGGDPSFQIAAQPGTGTWTAPGAPAALSMGPSQVITVNDGTRSIFVGAMWRSGVWRYIEP